MAITTVVKTIGSGGDFTTLQSWEDAKPLDLTDSRSSTTQAGSTSSTIFLDASASATTGAYVGHAVYCTARPTEKRLITAYNETSKVATVGSLNGSSATWATTPGTEAFTIDQCIWQGQIKNATDYFVGAQFANVLTISGSTSSSTCYAELTTAPGASWRDNATVATNALRYNPSNGCAIEGNPAFNKVIEVAEYAHLSNLQCFSTATGGALDSFAFVNTIAQNCIFDFDADQCRIVNGGSLINCLIVSRGGSTTGSTGLFSTGGYGTPDIIGCTIVNSKNSGSAGVVTSYNSINLKNCAIFGFLAPVGDAGGGNTWTITTCATDCSTATHTPGWTFSIPYSTATFQNVTEATRDYRLVSGSGLIGIGTTDSTNQPIDIRGTTRPQGTGYDIGCWEFAAPPSHESYLAFDGDPNTYAISAQLLATEAYWIKIDLGSPFLVDSYKYKARADGVFNAWKTWILEGSNNNSTWTLVDTVTNEANFATGETRTYVCDTPSTYRYWRWTVTASEGTYADVASLELYNNQLVIGALGLAAQPDTLVAAGNVPSSDISGTLSLPEQPDTIVAAGGPSVGATLGVPEAPDTIAATGGATVGGALSQPQAAQTLAATAGPVVGGALNQPQAAQTLAATAGPVARATLSIPQAAHTIASNASVVAAGALSQPQAPNTLAAIGGPRTAGALNQPQAAQTIVAAAGPVARGNLATPQANQTIAATGVAIVGGALNQPQAAHVLAATGAATVSGALAQPQAQTLAATGSVVSGVGGALNQNQAAQTIVAAGTVPLIVSGALTVIETPDALAATGLVRDVVSGALSLPQAPQAFTGSGTIRVDAALGVIQANQTISAGAASSITARLAVETVQTLAAHADVLAAAHLTAVEADDTLISIGFIGIVGIPGQPGVIPGVPPDRLDIAEKGDRLVVATGNDRLVVAPRLRRAA